MTSNQHQEPTLRARQLLARFTGLGGMTHETKVEIVRKINVELDGIEEQLEAQRHAAEQMSRSLARAHEGEQRYNQMQFEANAKVTELREQLEAAHVAVIRHMNEVRATQEHLWAIAQSYDPARAEESARVMYDIARSNTPQRDEHGRLLDPEWAEKMIERWQPDSSPAMRQDDPSRGSARG